MLWFVYNVLFVVGYLTLLPHFLLRMWRRGGYRPGFLQRLAIYTPETVRHLRSRRRIWIHAVSVGEVYVALQFMNELRTADPGTAFVLTTTTSTGHRIAENELCSDDVLLYFPSDFPFIIKRVLNVLQPRAIILTECELWPNLIRITRTRNIPVILINGRISDSSFRGYRLLKVFFSRVLKCIDLFLVQTTCEEKRLIELGADPGSIKVMGTAKYDVARFDPAGEKGAREILETAGMNSNCLIIVGGSTWSGEEGILLDVYRHLKGSFENLKLVLVPRHAERCAQVETEIEKHKLSHVRRSLTGRAGTDGARKESPDVMLVDTTGELKNFYACASVIFVGKSLTNHGGQNVIEPALYGKPIVVGPHTENFPVVISHFLAADALIQVQNAKELEQAFRSLLANRDLREAYGRRASTAVQEKRGVIRNSVGLISGVMGT